MKVYINPRNSTLFKIWCVFREGKWKETLTQRLKIILEFLSGLAWQVADKINFCIPFLILRWICFIVCIIIPITKASNHFAVTSTFIVGRTCRSNILALIQCQEGTASQDKQRLNYSLDVKAGTVHVEPKPSPIQIFLKAGRRELKWTVMLALARINHMSCWTSCKLMLVKNKQTTDWDFESLKRFSTNSESVNFSPQKKDFRADHKRIMLDIINITLWNKDKCDLSIVDKNL